MEKATSSIDPKYAGKARIAGGPNRASSTPAEPSTREIAPNSRIGCTDFAKNSWWARGELNPHVLSDTGT